jgi:DNA-binding response OmpR family regulator
LSEHPEADPRLTRVLVVEDEAALRGLLDIAIRDIGNMESLACGTCAEALEKGPDFRPDLMVVDLQLTDGDGIELIAALQARPALARVPAVLLTARPSSAKDRSQGNPAIAGVLGKPFDPMSLPRILTRLWLDWRENTYG